jgi:hypothetical protein
MDKSYKTWDNNLEEDNLEDGAGFGAIGECSFWRLMGKLWWCKEEGKVDRN